MKKLHDNPKPPQELFAKTSLGEFASVNRYYCGECGTIHVDKEYAAKCCLQEYCECGNPLPKAWLCCNTCRDLKKEEKAEVVTEYEGMLYDGDDRYFHDMEEVLDYYADDKPENRPEFIYCTTEDRWAGLNVDDALESSLEEYCDEDGEPYDHLVDEEKLRAFVTEWNKKQNVRVYWGDDKRKVRVPWEELNTGEKS